MSELSSSNWSETAASNNAASPNGAPESMNPSGVNDTIREMMSALKKFWGRIQGRYAATGSSNAYVVTLDVALSAYSTGERYSFRANHDCTGASTVNISSLGAKDIKKMTSAGKTALASGDIKNGQPVTVEYDGTDMIMVTPIANAATGTVTSVAGGSGLSGGTITTTGTLALDINSLTTDSTPDAAADYVATYDASAAANKKVLLSKIGKIVQRRLTQTSTANSWSTATEIPRDGTTPTNSEGNSAMSDSITLGSASNTVRVHGSAMVACGTVAYLTLSLWRGSTFLAAMNEYSGGSDEVWLRFDYTDTPGSVGPHTYTVRVGSNLGATTPVYFNRLSSSATQPYGASGVSSCLILDEVAA